MHRLSWLIVVLVGVAAVPEARAQEMNCAVAVNRSLLQGTEYTFLDELQEDLERYINSRAWTEDVFAAREQIDCQVQLVFRSAPTLTQFSGEIVVQSSRPIYGTGQRTTVFVASDNAWTFSYTRGQNLVYDPNRYDAFLSVIEFYVYLMLGYDHDSFEEMGGQRHFEEARRIAELARGAGQPVGWGTETTDGRSRYDLIQQLLDPAFANLRRAHFAYHFGVLDHFLTDQALAWERTLEVLAVLNEQFLQFNQRRYATDVFFTAKYQELAELLRDAPQRNQAYALLAQMDPAHLSTYDALTGGR